MSAEFVVLNIGSDTAKIGASYTILGVAGSESEAMTLLETLPAATASKVAILEKKAVIKRIPAVKLEELNENMIQ